MPSPATISGQTVANTVRPYSETPITVVTNIIYSGTAGLSVRLHSSARGELLPGNGLLAALVTDGQGVQSVAIKSDGVHWLPSSDETFSVMAFDVDTPDVLLASFTVSTLPSTLSCPDSPTFHLNRANNWTLTIGGLLYNPSPSESSGLNFGLFLVPVAYSSVDSVAVLASKALYTSASTTWAYEPQAAGSPTMTASLTLVPARLQDQSDVACALWWRDDNTMAALSPSTGAVLHFMSAQSVPGSVVHAYSATPVTVCTHIYYMGAADLAVRLCSSTRGDLYGAGSGLRIALALAADDQGGVQQTATVVSDSLTWVPAADEVFTVTGFDIHTPGVALASFTVPVPPPSTVVAAAAHSFQLRRSGDWAWSMTLQGLVHTPFETAELNVTFILARSSMDAAAVAVAVAAQTLGTLTSSWDHEPLMRGSALLSDKACMEVAGGGGTAMGTGDFTWECWVYPTANESQQRDWQTLIDTRTYPGANDGLYFGTLGGSMNLAAKAYNAGVVLTSSIALTLNAWNHVALTQSGRAVTIWVNGASGGTAGNAITLTAQRVYIGGNPTGSHFYGNLTNLRIVKGVALYTRTFAPPTAELTAVAGTQLLLLCGDADGAGLLFDSSSNNFEATVVENTVVWAAQRPGAVLGTATLALTLAPTEDLADITCAVWWHDDGTPLTRLPFPDVQAVLHVISGNPAAGSVNFFNVTPTTVFTNLYSPSSVAQSLAVRLSSSVRGNLEEGDGLLLVALDTTSGQGAWSVTVVSAGTDWLPVAGEIFTVIAFSIATPGTPGVSLTTFTVEMPPPSTLVATLAFSPFDLRKANSWTMALPGLRYTPHGTADLNLTFILARSDMGARAVAAASAAQTLDTLTSFWDHEPLMRGSALFGGSCLTVAGGDGTAMGTGDFTWECWIYPTASESQQGGWQTLLETRTYLNGSVDGFYFGTFPGGMNLVVFTYTTVLVSSVAVAVNVWNHVALTQTDHAVTIWVNGASGGTAANAWSLTAQRLYIGGNPGGNYFYGNLTNLRIVKGVALYARTFTPPTAELAAVTGTQLLLLCGDADGAGLLLDSSPNNFGVTATGGVAWASRKPSEAILGTATLALTLAPTQDLSDITCAVWWHDDGTPLTRLPFPAVQALLRVISGDPVPGTVHPYSATPTTVCTHLYYPPNVLSLAVGLRSSVRGNLEVGDGLLAALVTDSQGARSVAVLSDGTDWLPAAGETFTVVGYSAGTPPEGVSLVAFTVSSPSTLYFPNPLSLSPFYLQKANGWAMTLDQLLYGAETPGGPGLEFFLVPASYTSIDVAAVAASRDLGSLTSSWEYPPLICGSALFSDSYLTVDGDGQTAMGTADFTWECWVRLAGSVGYQTFLDSRSRVEGSGDGFFFGTLPDTHTPLLFSDHVVLQSSLDMVPDAWNHVAVTQASGEVTLWVNGASGGTAGNWQTLSNSSMRIGGAPGGNYFLGHMTNLCILKGVAAYTLPFTPVTGSRRAETPGLQLQLQLQLLHRDSAGLLADSSPNDLLVEAALSGSVAWSAETPPFRALLGTATLAIPSPTPAASSTSCAVWWRDDNTMASRSGVQAVLRPPSLLTPGSITPMLLNRLNDWSVSFDATYHGSAIQTFLVSIVPATDTCVMTTTTTTEAAETRLTIRAAFAAQPTAQAYSLFWDDADTPSRLYTAIMIPRRSSITATASATVASGVPLLRFLPADVAIFTYTYVGDAAASLRFFIVRASSTVPTTAADSAAGLASLPGLSLSVAANSIVYLHIDATMIDDAYLLAHASDAYLAVYAYDDNTAAHTVQQNITIRTPSVITDDAAAELTFHHVNNWAVDVHFSGVDRETLRFYTLPPQLDLLTVAWPSPPEGGGGGTLRIYAAENHPLRQTGGTVLLAWDDATTALHSAWKTCTFPAPTSLDPAGAAAGTLTLNRLNKWQCAFTGIRYAGSYIGTFDGVFSRRNGRVGIPDVLRVDVAVNPDAVPASVTVGFSIDAASLATPTDEQYQLWWFDDTVEFSLYANIAIPRQCSLGALYYYVSPVLPAPRFSPANLFQATYSGAARASMRVFVLSDRDAAAENTSLPQSSVGLVVTTSSFTLPVFIATLNVSTAVFTDAYMRAHVGETFQLYIYDDNTAPRAIPDTTFSLVQPSSITPALSSSGDEIKFRWFYNWSLQFPYEGVEVQTVRFFALQGPAPDATDAPPTYLTALSNDTAAEVLTVAIDPTTLHASGAAFDIWWDDGKTSLSLWKHVLVPPVARMSGSVDALALTFANRWSHTFVGRTYTGDVLLDDLQVYICSAADGVNTSATSIASLSVQTIQTTSEGALLSMALDMQPHVPATDTAYNVWWSDVNTPPTLLATVPGIAARSMITQKTNAPHPSDVVSRLQDALPISLFVASYRRHAPATALSPPLQFIALLLSSPVVYEYVSIAGMAIATTPDLLSGIDADVDVDVSVGITIDERAARFTNDFVLANPHLRYQVYAFDANTPLTAVGASFSIEPPTELFPAPAPSPAAPVYLSLATAWTQTLFFTTTTTTGEQAARNLRFFTDSTSLNTVSIVVSPAGDAVTVSIAETTAAVAEAFTLYWEDDATTPVAWRVFTVSEMSVLTILPGDDAAPPPPAVVNKDTNWTWTAQCEYVGTAFDDVSVYALPASYVTFSTASAMAVGSCSGTAARAHISVPAAALASTSTRNSFRVWWKDRNTLPSSIGAGFDVGISSSVVVATEPSPLTVVRRFVSQQLLHLTYSGSDSAHFSVVAVAVSESSAFTNQDQDQYAGTPGLVLSAAFGPAPSPSPSPSASSQVIVTASIDNAIFTNAYLRLPQHLGERFQTYYFDTDTPLTAVGPAFVIQAPSVISPAASSDADADAAIMIDTSNSFTASVAFSGVDLATAVFSVFLTADATVPIATAETGIARVQESTFIISVPPTSQYRLNYGSDGGTAFFVFWQDAVTATELWRRFFIPAQSTLVTASSADSAHTTLTALAAWTATIPTATYSGSTMGTLEFQVLPHNVQTYASGTAVSALLAVIVATRNVVAATVSLALDFSELAATLTAASAYNIWWSDAHTTWRILRAVDVSKPSTFAPAALLYTMDNLFTDNRLVDVVFTSYDALGSSVVCVATPTSVTRAEDVLANVCPSLSFTTTLRVETSSTSGSTTSRTVLQVAASRMADGFASKLLWYRPKLFRNWHLAEHDELAFNLWAYDDFSRPSLLNASGVFTTGQYENELNRGNDWTYTVQYTYSGDNPARLQFTASIPGLTLDYTPHLLTRPAPDVVVVSIPKQMLVSMAGLRLNLLYEEDETTAPGAPVVDYSVTPYPARFVWKVFNLNIDYDSASLDGVALDVQTSADGTFSSLSVHSSLDSAVAVQGFTIWAFDMNTPLFQILDAEITFVYDSTLSAPAPGPSHVSASASTPVVIVTLFEGIVYTGSALSTLRFAPCAVAATAFVPDDTISAAVVLTHTVVGNVVSVQARVSEAIFAGVPDGSLPAFAVWATDDNTPSGMPVTRIIYVDRDGSALPLTITDDSVELNGANNWTYAGGIVVTSATPLVAHATPVSVTAETFSIEAAIAFSASHVWCTCTVTGPATVAVTVVAAPSFTGAPFAVWVQTTDPDDHVPATRIPTVFSVASSILADVQRIPGTATGIRIGDAAVPLFTAQYVGTSIVRFIALSITAVSFSRDADMAAALQGVALAYDATTRTVSVTLDPQVFTLPYFAADGVATFSVWVYEATTSKTFRIQEQFDVIVLASGLSATQVRPPLASALPDGTPYIAATVVYTPARPRYALQGVGIPASAAFSAASALQGVRCVVVGNGGVLAIEVDKLFYGQNALSTTVDAVIDVWLYDESTALFVATLPVPVIFQTWSTAVTRLACQMLGSVELVAFMYAGREEAAGVTVSARSPAGDAFPPGAIVLTTMPPTSVATSIEVWATLNFSSAYFLDGLAARTFSLFAHDSSMAAPAAARPIGGPFTIVPPASSFTPSTRAVATYLTFRVGRDQADTAVCTLDYVAYADVDSLTAVATAPDAAAPLPSSPSSGTALTAVAVLYGDVLEGMPLNGRRQILVRVSPADLARTPYNSSLRLRVWLYDDNTPPDIENSILVQLLLSSLIVATPLPGASHITVADGGANGATTVARLFTVDYAGVALESLAFTASIPGVSFSWPPATATTGSPPSASFDVAATVAKDIWQLNGAAVNSPLAFTVSAIDNNTAVRAFDTVYSITGVFQTQDVLTTDLALRDSDVPVLDIAYGGTRAADAVTVRAVFPVWNSFPAEAGAGAGAGVAAAFVPGVSGSVSVSQQSGQWTIRLTADAAASSNFSDSVDEVYFDLWAYDTPTPDAPTRLTTGGTFSLSATLMIGGVVDGRGNALAVGDSSLYMFPFNASVPYAAANTGSILICTLEVYGGKSAAHAPATALFGVYMQAVAPPPSAVAAVAFPNPLHTVQRGLAAGVSFIDVFTSAANLEDLVTYTAAFKLVIVDSLDRSVERILQLTSFPRQVYTFTADEPAAGGGIFRHAYNSGEAFSVSPGASVASERVVVGRLALNGVDIDAQTTLSGYDTAVFSVDGAAVAVLMSALSSTDQRRFGCTATYLRQAFTVPDTALYVYRALEVWGAGPAVVCSESNISDVRLAFTVRGGLGSFSATVAIDGHAGNAGIPGPLFVQDGSPENGLASTTPTLPSVAVLADETSLGFGSVALRRALPLPAGGTTSCLTRYATITVAAHGLVAASPDRRVLVLIYSDLVPPRVQLQRLGCLGNENTVNLQNTTRVFVHTEIIAGGYLDATASLRILPESTADTFVASSEWDIDLATTLPRPASLSFAFTDGRAATCEAVTFIVSPKPGGTFPEPDIGRYILVEVEVGNGTVGHMAMDTPRFLYRRGDGGGYELPQPAVTGATMTTADLTVSAYNGAEVLYRDWTPDGRTVATPTTPGSPYILTGQFLDTCIYRVALLYTELPFAPGQLLRVGGMMPPVIARTDAATLATHTYLIEVLVENRALHITPGAGGGDVVVYDPETIAANYIPPSMSEADAARYTDYLPATEQNGGAVVLGTRTFAADMVVVCNTDAPLFAFMNVKYWDSFTLALVPATYVFSTLSALQAVGSPTAALQFARRDGSTLNVLCVDPAGRITNSSTAAYLPDVLGIVAPNYNPGNESYVLYFVHDVNGDVRALETYPLAFFASALLVSSAIVLSRSDDLSMQGPDKLRLAVQVSDTLSAPVPERLVFSLQCKAEEGDDDDEGLAGVPLWTEISGNFDAEGGDTLADIQALIQNTDWPERDAALHTLTFRLCLQNTLVKRYGVEMQASNVLLVSDWRSADAVVAHMQYDEFIYHVTNVHIRIGVRDDGLFHARGTHFTSRTIVSDVGYRGGVRQVLSPPHIYLAFS